MLPLTFESDGFFFKDYTLLGEYESGLIIDWTNHPDIRKASSPISYLDFFDLIEELKEDTTRRYFFITKVYPIGCIKIEKVQELSSSTHIVVAPELLERGFEKKIEEAVLRFL